MANTDDAPDIPQKPDLSPRYAKRIIKDRAYTDSEGNLKTASLAYDPEWRKWAGEKTAKEAESASQHLGITKKKYQDIAKKDEDTAFHEEGEKANSQYQKASGMDKIEGSYKKGGRVKKTGKYLVHSGERVLTNKQQKSKKKQKTKR